MSEIIYKLFMKEMLKTLLEVQIVDQNQNILNVKLFGLHQDLHLTTQSSMKYSLSVDLVIKNIKKTY